MKLSYDNTAIKLPFPVRWDVVALVLLITTTLGIYSTVQCWA